MQNNGRRLGEILLGFILLLIGLSSFSSVAPFFLLLGVVGFFFLARNFSQFEASTTERPRRTDARDRAYDDESRVSSREPHIYDHALDAARRAGIELDGAKVYPIDIGVMSFSADGAPRIHRTTQIPDDVDYIQPFVQIHLPLIARGRVRFEIHDAVGEAVFIHETETPLSKGANLVTPAARLPIHDVLDFEGAWELRVVVDGVPLAVLPMDWRETGSRLLRQHIQEDGEISNELQALVDDSRLGRMSLDELLSRQEESDPETNKRAQRR